MTASARRRPLPLAAAVLVALLAAPPAAGAAPPLVTVDGRIVAFDVPPHIAAGRVMVPVRPAARALGCTVGWDGGTRTVSLQRGDQRVRLNLPSGRAQVHAGEKVRVVLLHPAPRIVDGSTIAGLRFLVEVCAPGADLRWNASRREAAVRTAAHPATGGAPRRPFILSYYSEEEPPDAPKGAYPSLVEHGEAMSAVAGFFSRLQVDRYGNATGALEPLDTAAYSARRRLVATARKLDRPAYLLIHNLLYGRAEVGPRAAGQVLADAELRRRLVGHLQQILAAEDYDGVNIDFEGVPAAHRDAYTRFVGEVADALRPAGYAVTLSVPAKTRDAPSNSWSYPYDYKALGKLVDRIVLMTYDYHNALTGPGPIAPLDWVARVAAYARETMPPERVLVGIAAYGFDWTLDGDRPRYLGARQALELAERTGARVEADPALGATFRYRDAAGRAHVVWFETAETLAAKLDVVDRLDLGGVAIWRIGLEDPKLWSLLRGWSGGGAARAR